MFPIVRPFAVGALSTTVTASITIITQIQLDVSHGVVFCNGSTVGPDWQPSFPPPEPLPYFTAFGSIMFAYGGASTFPTIQADMLEKTKFNYSVAIAMFGKWTIEPAVVMLLSHIFNFSASFTVPTRGSSWIFLPRWLCSGKHHWLSQQRSSSNSGHSSTFTASVCNCAHSC